MTSTRHNPSAKCKTVCGISDTLTRLSSSKTARDFPTDTSLLGENHSVSTLLGGSLAQYCAALGESISLSKPPNL